MINIKVPATSANIGPGFDTLGLALELYNHFRLEKRDDGEKNIYWDQPQMAICDDDNLAKTSLEYTLKKQGMSNLGYDLFMGECNVPMSRGLGSSATAIIAGIIGANYLLDFSLSNDDMLLYATELEGHPDNVAPALLGDMIISQQVAETVIYDRIVFPNELVFKVMVPNFKLSTAKARSVLPESYSRKECIFNISRIGLLINCLYTKKFEVLKYALDDAIHQPFRLPLIPTAKEIFEKCNGNKVYGSFISGAGPTLIAMVDHEVSDHFDASMTPFLNMQEQKWDLMTLSINRTGASYTVS